MSPSERVLCPRARSRIMSADEAASLIPHESTIGMSGFTGAGFPKVLPQALARRVEVSRASGSELWFDIWTGASTAPGLDGILSQARAIRRRLPYQSDPTCRDRINAGELEYVDMHLGRISSMACSGILGDLDTTIIEVTKVLPGGHLVPSTSVGNNTAWLRCARQVILEVNEWQNEKLEGMHDICCYGCTPPHGQPIPIVAPDTRIGEPYLSCDPAKIAAVVRTNAPDRNSVFSEVNGISKDISGHIIDFLRHEVARGRMPKSLLPIQTGVGNTANAVSAGLAEGPFDGLTAWTEVLPDSMIDLMLARRLVCASATALCLSPSGAAKFNDNIDFLQSHIVLRPQEITNHPEIIRRLGCIAINGMIEADLYGNVNSTHVGGTLIQNGVGGSADFARNAHLNFFVSHSQARGGAVSCIVPMVSHVDHPEHDVHVIVTERGLADLRALPPRQRALRIIDNCAHPDFRPRLRDYYDRALAASRGKQTPHILGEALGWHIRYERDGRM